MLYNLSLLKIGLKVLQNKEPCIIIGIECIKPGKGQSFSRIRLKQIISGKILERTLKSGEFLESVDIIEIDLIYVYRDDNLWYFMNEKNFEQIGVDSRIIGEFSKWIIEQSRYTVTLWNGNPILVIPPNCIELKVVKTTPIMKTVAISSGNKLATLSTGVIIKVPCFVQIGESIRVNTRSGTYMSRVK